MTCGRAYLPDHKYPLDSAAVSPAELVRGQFLLPAGGPLIRPSCRRRVFDTTGTFSPRGEGIQGPLEENIGRKQKMTRHGAWLERTLSRGRHELS